MQEKFPNLIRRGFAFKVLLLWASLRAKIIVGNSKRSKFIDIRILTIIM